MKSFLIVLLLLAAGYGVSLDELTEAQVDEMLKKIDEDGDSKISSVEELRKILSLLGQNDLNDETLAEIFSDIDKEDVSNISGKFYSRGYKWTAELNQIISTAKLKETTTLEEDLGTTMSIIEDPAVTNFREYLRIPSVHPNVNYDGCIAFLQAQAKGLDLPVRIYQVVTGKPIVVLTWTGSQPALPSVLLNSHMDVVPVFPEKWKYGPFSAEKDANGNIYARGSQDMKCVGIQYLEAIRRLKKAGVTLSRTLHISFVPDEEIGGTDGMEKFVKTQDFKNLNVGFALDEGMASPNDEFLLYYGERSIWHVFIHCPGTPGHGSLMLPDTAGEKVEIIINRFMDLRRKEKAKLESNKNLTVGDVTTINLTQIKGGVQPNVVPPELVVGFDCRLATNVNHADFEKMIEGWCREAGPGTYMEFVQKNNFVPNTRLDNSNPWWQAFQRECDQMNLKLKPSIFPGGTDSRYVREVGIPALGFSPIVNTPVLLHDHDEFLNEKVFLEGIKIYERIITAVANV